MLFPNFYEIRKTAGVQQSEMAAELRVHSATIRGWESSRQVPDERVAEVKSILRKALFERRRQAEAMLELLADIDIPENIRRG